MGGPLAVWPEVVNCTHERRAHVPEPDVVDRHTRGQWIFLARDPAGQGQTPAAAHRWIDGTKRLVLGRRLGSGFLCRQQSGTKSRYLLLCRRHGLFQLGIAWLQGLACGWELLLAA